MFLYHQSLSCGRRIHSVLCVMISTIVCVFLAHIELNVTADSHPPPLLATQLIHHSFCQLWTNKRTLIIKPRPIPCCCCYRFIVSSPLSLYCCHITLWRLPLTKAAQQPPQVPRINCPPVVLFASLPSRPMTDQLSLMANTAQAHIIVIVIIHHTPTATTLTCLHDYAILLLSLLLLFFLSLREYHPTNPTNQRHLNGIPTVRSLPLHKQCHVFVTNKCCPFCTPPPHRNSVKQGSFLMNHQKSSLNEAYHLIELSCSQFDVTKQFS